MNQNKTSLVEQTFEQFEHELNSGTFYWTEENLKAIAVAMHEILIIRSVNRVEEENVIIAERLLRFTALLMKESAELEPVPLTKGRVFRYGYIKENSRSALRRVYITAIDSMGMPTQSQLTWIAELGSDGETIKQIQFERKDQLNSSVKRFIQCLVDAGGSSETIAWIKTFDSNPYRHRPVVHNELPLDSKNFNGLMELARTVYRTWGMGDCRKDPYIGSNGKFLKAQIDWKSADYELDIELDLPKIADWIERIHSLTMLRDLHAVLEEMIEFFESFKDRRKE